MEKNSRAFLYLLIFGLIIAFLYVLTMINSSYVHSKSKPNGFIASWAATRMFLINGWSPYSEETSQEIKRTYEEISEEESDIPPYFVYPFYLMLIITPFALIPNLVVAETFWLLFLELSILGMMGISFLLSNWKPKTMLLIAVFLFTLSWYHTVKPLLDYDVSIIVILFVVAGMVMIRLEFDAFAGFLFALSTVKPQITIVLIFYLSLWAFSQKRWKVIIGLFGSLLVMSLVGGLFVPDWILQNIRQVYLYAESIVITSSWLVLQNWLPGVGKQLGWALTGITIIILLVEWKRSFQSSFRRLLWTSMLTIASTALLGLYITLDDYVLMYPALIFVFSVWDFRWKRIGWGLILFYIVILVFGLWGILISLSQNMMSVDLNPLIFFYTPFLTVLGLYWVKYWAIRPLSLPYEEISKYFD